MIPASGTPRVALLTGLTRRIGIAASVLARLLADDFCVYASGWSAHDAEMDWGADPTGGAQLITELDPTGRRLHYEEADLEDPATPAALVDATVDRFGHIDAVVAVHARSSHNPLATVTAEELDRCWAINTRGSLLLAQRFGQVFDSGRGDGRVLFFTSGQHLEPMGAEIAYAISKGAIQQMTASVADQLADQGITVNCINPGPVDTGYAEGDFHAQVEGLFPSKRWGQPVDVANLASFLLSPEGAWMTGQTLNSEGGFRRYALRADDRWPTSGD